MFFFSTSTFCSAEELRLVLELEIRLLQFLLLRLQLLRQRLRLLQEILRTHVRLDRVQHDADRLRELVEEDLVRRAEMFERSELDDRLHLAFEKHGSTIRLSGVASPRPDEICT
jgi:hypothetical protein